MKRNYRLLSLLLAVLMVISAVAFTSCANDKNDKTDDGSETTPFSQETTVEVVETTAAPTTGNDLVFVSGGKSNVSVIRSDTAGNSDTAVVNAAGIRNEIGTITGVTPVITTDWVKRGTEHDPNTIEILVGDTNYPETAEVLKDLSYGEYCVRVVGNKLVVAGFTDAAISLASTKVKQLVKLNYKDGTLTIPGDTNFVAVVDKVLNSVPAFENGTMKAACKGADEAELLYITNTDADAYNAYLTKLESNGFTKYTDNNINNNLFTTFTSDKYTLTAIFYNADKAVRLILEDKGDLAGLASENNYKKVTTSCIVSVGVGYKNGSGEEQNIALSMLLRFADGRFLIVDGGYSRQNDATQLLTRMTELSKDYINNPDYCGKGKIDIAAWIVTHPHGDHQGAMNKYYTTFKNCIVERFLYSFWSESERNKSYNAYPDNYSSGEGSGVTAVVTAAASLGAKLHIVRPGQVFYIGDAKIENLYTLDSYLPTTINAVNTMSTVYKVTYESGDTFMITGDATGGAFAICNKMYGTYLESDIMQLSHHGCSTWGNDSGTAKAYTLMKAPTIIWPSTEGGMNSRIGKSYNAAAFSSSFTTGGQNPNFKEVYVAGMENEYVIYNIPYTVGEAIEHRLNK